MVAQFRSKLKITSFPYDSVNETHVKRVTDVSSLRSVVQDIACTQMNVAPSPLLAKMAAIDRARAVAHRDSSPLVTTIAPSYGATRYTPSTFLGAL